MMPDDDRGDVVEVRDDDLPDMAFDLWLLRITRYIVWCDPTRGAVWPALSEFFHFCDPHLPALVHWAGWLRLAHESDDRIDRIAQPLEEDLVEVMIQKDRVSDAVARAMRRA
jgi:hypothetical protein